MGVAGSGKTDVGEAVAARMGWTFVDADDVHSADNIAKMRSGVALNDADRRPWLSALNQVLRSSQKEGVDLVLACSALRRTYRQTLAEDVAHLKFVYLEVPEDVIRERVRTRLGHFVPAELVDSQFAAIEPPSGDTAILIDADRLKAEVVDQVVAELRKWLSD